MADFNYGHQGRSQGGARGARAPPPKPGKLKKNGRKRGKIKKNLEKFKKNQEKMKIIED